MNETRYEDAAGDDQGILEAQDQDRELQKMHMDFEENDAASGHGKDDGKTPEQT